MDLQTLAGTPPWEWPVSARDLLLGVLRNEAAEESDRLTAAELAGDMVVIDDEIFDVLLSIVSASNEVDTLRGQAALSLGPVLEHLDLEGFGEIEGFEELDSPPISDRTFENGVQTLRNLYMDQTVPENVRRYIFEASVRAPQDWHVEAVRTHYASDDPAWKLSSVFAMRWIRGFDLEILDALASDNDDIKYEAVLAAGNRSLRAAWPQVSVLLSDGTTDKGLLLAVIEATVGIRPDDAGLILTELTQSEDEDIVEAAYEAMALLDAEYDDDNGYDDSDEDAEGDAFRLH